MTAPPLVGCVVWSQEGGSTVDLNDEKIALSCKIMLSYHHTFFLQNQDILQFAN